MPDKHDNPLNFWQELKRRKVIGVIIAYAAVGWAIIEIIDTITEPLNLPGWTLTLVIVLVAVGFPIAVIFAWIFDITTKGIKKTEPLYDDTENEDVRSATENRVPPEKSIIVLPFENISSDPGQDYFSDGLTEELITHMSYIDDLVVISRSSAMTFKGGKSTVKEIAEKVNVKYVLEGSVRKSGNNLRITAQLINAESDSHLWAKNYDGTLNDIFDIQEKVSVAIANELKIRLVDTSQPRNTGGSINDLQIFEIYYKANANIFKFTEKDTNKAINDLDNAIEELGDQALLYTCKGWAFWMLVNMGIKQDDYLSRAKENLDKALSIQPGLARALAIYAWVEFLSCSFTEGIIYLKKAIEIDPNESFALNGLTTAYSFIGKKEEATKLYVRLEKVDPLNDITLWCKGSIPFYSGNFDTALKGWHDFYADNPIPFKTFYYAFAMFYVRDIEEVLDLIEPAINEESQYFPDKLLRIFRYSITKEKEKLLAELDAMTVKTCKRDGTYSQHLAVLLSYSGLKKEALDWLEQAINKGYINYPMIESKDKHLDNIRGEERFKELVKRVKKEWDEIEI